jgi:hypothetical protein
VRAGSWELGAGISGAGSWALGASSSERAVPSCHPERSEGAGMRTFDEGLRCGPLASLRVTTHMTPSSQRLAPRSQLGAPSSQHPPARRAEHRIGLGPGAAGDAREG